MSQIYEQNGNGLARDGRSFDPPIPAGATVSWRRLTDPIYVSQQGRCATHVLSVWDRHNEMQAHPTMLQQTSRGLCVMYYADSESLRDLMESAVPAPAWIDARVPTEVTLSECILAMQAPHGPDAATSIEFGMARLRTAVWTYRTLTDGWPILKIRVDPAAPLPAAVLHDEANRLFEMVRDELAEQMHTRWWESRIQTSA